MIFHIDLFIYWRAGSGGGGGIIEHVIVPKLRSQYLHTATAQEQRYPVLPVRMLFQCVSAGSSHPFGQMVICPTKQLLEEEVDETRERERERKIKKKSE